MAIIGTFTRTADGFSGSLKTLTLNSKLQFVPETNKSSDSAPDYRNAPSPEPRKQQGRRPCDPARDRRSLDPRLRGTHPRLPRCCYRPADERGGSHPFRLARRPSDADAPGTGKAGVLKGDA